jgi:hypothetical protein
MTGTHAASDNCQSPSLRTPEPRAWIGVRRGIQVGPLSLSLFPSKGERGHRQTHTNSTNHVVSEILSPRKRREPNSPSPYPLPRGEGDWPVAGNVEAPRLVIARRILLPLLWGEGRVRGNRAKGGTVRIQRFLCLPVPSGSAKATQASPRGVPRWRTPVAGITTYWRPRI